MKARDGHFGNRRQRSFSIPIRGLALDNNPDADNADERRLFYVALTRAKKSVTITYSITGEAGQHYLPTQFIEEMDKDLLELASPASLASKALDYDFLKPRIYAGPKFSDKEYLKNLFLNQGLSVTALNNYLDCPWKYFSKYVTNAGGKPATWFTAAVPGCKFLMNLKIPVNLIKIIIQNFWIGAEIWTAHAKWF